MADDVARMNPNARNRIYGEDPENITVTPPEQGGLETSPEALEILKTQGVQAHEQWVREHTAAALDPDRPDQQ